MFDQSQVIGESFAMIPASDNEKYAAIKYKAPELYLEEYKGTYTELMDVYQVGVMLVDLCRNDLDRYSETLAEAAEMSTHKDPQ